MSNTQTFEYPAVRFQQSVQGGKLVLSSAPVNDIVQWAGIPRKEQKKGVETVGFQRTENTRRVKEIGQFLNQDQNVIANPILCAARDKKAFTFEAHQSFDGGRMETGVLRVSVPDYSAMSMKELLSEVRAVMEERSPSLKDVEVSDAEVTEFKRNAAEVETPAEDENPDNDAILVAVEEATDDAGDSAAESGENESVVFSTESHIEDFYKAVRVRQKAVEQSNADFEALGGFSKPFLRDYLKAAMIVDGQHRLLGAQKELLSRIDDAGTEIEELIDANKTKAEAEQELQHRYARRFGISLIMDSDWPEHVFQFVVVNQKASPISKPLLASIIATTLTNSEITSIKDRLTQAGISVSDYVALNYMNSAAASPFKGLIKRGIGDEGEQKKLDHTVGDFLIQMFRYLKNGRPLHSSGAQDYAQFWGASRLNRLRFLDDYANVGFESPRAYWEAEDGSWREFFVTFWTAVRDIMANVEDENAFNYWGYPKKSNLFNGVQLKVLSTDFWEFLWNRNPEIKDMAHLQTVISDDWLEFVRPRCQEYFNRDWQLPNEPETLTVKRLAFSWWRYRIAPGGDVPNFSSDSLQRVQPKPTQKRTLAPINRISKS